MQRQPEAFIQQKLKFKVGLKTSIIDTGLQTWPARLQIALPAPIMRVWSHTASPNRKGGCAMNTTPATDAVTPTMQMQVTASVPTIHANTAHKAGLEYMSVICAGSPREFAPNASTNLAALHGNLMAGLLSATGSSNSLCPPPYWSRGVQGHPQV